MKQALETQLNRTFPTDMPDACVARLLHLSTGEHDKHILKWAGLGLPQPVEAGTEDVSGTAKPKKKRRTGRRTYTVEQCCDENSEEVAKLCKAWCQMFKEDVSKVKTLSANTREFVVVCDLNQLLHRNKSRNLVPSDRWSTCGMHERVFSSRLGTLVIVRTGPASRKKRYDAKFGTTKTARWCSFPLRGGC